MVSELTMLSGVRQDTLFVGGDGKSVMAPPSVMPAPLAGTAVPLVHDGDSTTTSVTPRRLPGDRSHTFLQLATPLSYCYRRDTVKVYANVAHATHGETREEPLGSGDPTQIFQTFVLKSRPLTYVSGPSTSGVESSLRVYVNDVRWREAENLLDLGPADRGYLTFADHEESTSVTFGDGHNGARLPKGVENVRSVYRSGIGKSGNVRPGQLSQLVTRTDGLRGVLNPQRASGGADPEGIESARARAPLAVAALDRLVATRDYADFALLFAGIGKASAARLPSRRGQLVQVTVAGEDDIPIDPESDLHRNLLEALRRFGDPHLPVQVVHRELLALVIGARVKLHPDYLWEAVRPQLEASLRNSFGFARRDLAQDAHAAEALAAMQGVPGVDYVDLDLFAAVSENTPASELGALGLTLDGVQDHISARPDRRSLETLAPLPAQLAVLVQSLPTTLMLTEIPHE
jgi:predicted phage baseplate assembly protein